VPCERPLRPHHDGTKTTKNTKDLLDNTLFVIFGRIESFVSS